MNVEWRDDETTTIQTNDRCHYGRREDGCVMIMNLRSNTSLPQTRLRYRLTRCYFNDTFTRIDILRRGEIG